jgi:hypothetical protein
MWAMILNAALGIWLVSAPSVLGYGNPARINDRVVGALVALLSIIAVAEVLRSLRRLDMLLGLWLLLAPWVLGYYPQSLVIANSIVTGVLVLDLSFEAGRTKHRLNGS